MYAIIIIHNQPTTRHYNFNSWHSVVKFTRKKQRLVCNIPWPTFYLLLFTLLKVFNFSGQLLLCWKHEMSDKFQCN
jgi:hypothetical protein